MEKIQKFNLLKFGNLDHHNAFGQKENDQLGKHHILMSENNQI